MPRTAIPDVLVMHAHGPMRMVLRLVLAQDYYTVAEAASYACVLRHLRTAISPTVVVAGNWTADYRAEADFFGQIARDVALSRRHHFVLLTTIPEWLPPQLDAMLRGLGVPVLKLPVEVPELLTAVALAAGRTPAGDASAG